MTLPMPTAPTGGVLKILKDHYVHAMTDIATRRVFILDYEVNAHMELVPQWLPLPTKLVDLYEWLGY